MVPKEITKSYPTRNLEWIWHVSFMEAPGFGSGGEACTPLMGAREWTWVPEEMHLHLQAETPITGILQQSYIYKKSPVEESC
ncbi:hypothetical protein SCLCIDRAFT_653185 [Scleroderma citrinum Foug A]|uniref:Uncharacterized protein n=1 Tax=Scleroderma citrinum Foug A TaxID=1036808 RepID=A0A0C2ZEF0_9AGAM|nr:hypothetical protein SCLCIDRAFT_653185 [Scleroderma citrinum Foug A]